MKLIVCFILSIAIANAATFNSNGSSSDVHAKINSASDGDTVTIPAGAFAWDSTVTISSTAITANSVLCISLKTSSGVITMQPYATAVTAGTSYTIAAGGGDNSTYSWIILETN